MKKLIALLLIALTSIAICGEITYIHGKEEIKPKTKECLIFEIDLTILKGTEVVDEQGSKHYHLDWIPLHTRRVVYFTQQGRFWRSYEGRTSSSNGLSGSATTHHAVVVMNTFEGDTDGYIAFNFSIGVNDNSATPPVNCSLSGKTQNRWDEEEQRYVLVSGSGVVSGHSYPTLWNAWGDLQKAALDVQSAITPAWGTFTVHREVLTDAEIVKKLRGE